jgi:hypothetical protein
MPDQAPIDSLKIPKYPSITEIKATGNIFVIGDVHGCIDELWELFAKVKNYQNNDNDYTMIFLGDLLDRGPYSREVVSIVRTLTEDFPDQYHCLLGNHEETHVRYERHLRTGGKNPMKKDEAFINTHLSLRPTDFDWMATLPTAIQWENFIFTHAGVIQGRGIRQETKGFLRNRFVQKMDDKYSPVGSWFDENLQKWCHPEGSLHWSEVYNEPTKIVYGHENWPEVNIRSNSIGIDTGAVYGGKLTAMVINAETKDVSFLSVPARKAYYK